MKVENVKMKGSWKEVLNDCRFTVGKPPLDKEPSDKFKEDMMIAEHTPIRDIEWKFDNHTVLQMSPRKCDMRQNDYRHRLYLPTF